MRPRLFLLIAGFLLGACLVLLGPSLPAGLAELFATGSAASTSAPQTPAAPWIRAPTAAPSPTVNPSAPAPGGGRADPEPTGVPQASTAPSSEGGSGLLGHRLADAALRERLERLVERAALSGPDPSLGLVVVDGRGAQRFGHRGAAAMVPASTQKLLTAAAALRTLGPDHRYVTHVLAGGPPAAGGVLAGDLLLRGSGDPTLATPEFAALDLRRPSTPLAALADQIAAAGVRRITGHVLGDAGPFTGDPLPQGWHPRYLTGLDGARSAGLTVNAGRRLSIVDGQLRGEAAEDPVVTAAAELVHLLGQRGVSVDGGAGRLAPGSTRDDLLHHLATVSSPPLHELLRFMVGASDNGIADQLFLTVGLVAAGEATWDGGARGVREALAELSLPWSGVHLADGSGLSRANRVPPALLTQLDVAMSRSALAQPWTSAMAVVGQHGTLRGRLRGSVVDGRARGKTGSLADVRALSGAVLGPTGRAYHFTLLANGLDGPGTQTVRALQDELLLALAEHLYGCVRVPLPPPSPAPSGVPSPSAPGSSPPAHELVCEAA